MTAVTSVVQCLALILLLQLDLIASAAKLFCNEGFELVDATQCEGTPVGCIAAAPTKTGDLDSDCQSLGHGVRPYKIEKAYELLLVAKYLDQMHPSDDAIIIEDVVHGGYVFKDQDNQLSMGTKSKGGDYDVICFTLAVTKDKLKHLPDASVNRGGGGGGGGGYSGGSNDFRGYEKPDFGSKPISIGEQSINSGARGRDKAGDYEYGGGGGGGGYNYVPYDDGDLDYYGASPRTGPWIAVAALIVAFFDGLLIRL